MLMPPDETPPQGAVNNNVTTGAPVGRVSSGTLRRRSGNLNDAGLDADQQRQAPLVVKPTDPHRLHSVSNMLNQICSNLHEVASRVLDMAGKFGDMGLRLLDIIGTRIG
jgi:hypothetical protein